MSEVKEQDALAMELLRRLKRVVNSKNVRLAVGHVEKVEGAWNSIHLKGSLYVSTLDHKSGSYSMDFYFNARVPDEVLKAAEIVISSRIEESK